MLNLVSISHNEFVKIRGHAQVGGTYVVLHVCFDQWLRRVACLCNVCQCSALALMAWPSASKSTW